MRQERQQTNTSSSLQISGWAAPALAVLFMVVLYYAIQLLTRVLEMYPYLGLSDQMTLRGNWVQTCTTAPVVYSTPSWPTILPTPRST